LEWHVTEGFTRPLTYPVTGRLATTLRVCGGCRGRAVEIRRAEHRQIAGACPVDREWLLQTTSRATDHRHTDGAHHCHVQSGSSSASMTNRLAMVVIWSDAQHPAARSSARSTSSSLSSPTLLPRRNLVDPAAPGTGARAHPVRLARARAHATALPTRRASVQQSTDAHQRSKAKRTTPGRPPRRVTG
jgi:hypothetical protein